MSGSMDFGVASHTSLSDSPVAHPSLFPFSGETNKYVIFGRTWCYWTFLSDFIWAWVRVVGFMGFYITGYCWWPVVLSVRETGITLLYDDASGVTRCPPYRRWRVSQFGIRAGSIPVPSGMAVRGFGFHWFSTYFCFFKKIYLFIYLEILLAPLCPVITNSIVYFNDDE